MNRSALLLLLCAYMCTDIYAQSTTEKRLRDTWYEVMPAGNHFIVSSGPLVTLFDATGRALFPFTYSTLQPGLDGCYIANGNIITDSTGYEIRKLREQVLYADQQNHRYRMTPDYNAPTILLRDAAGNDMKWVADTALWRSNRALVPQATGGHMLADTLGRPLIKKAGAVSESKKYAAVVANDTAWLYTTQGKLLCHRRADECMVFPNDMVAVRQYGMWALMNIQGELLTDFRYNKFEDKKHTNAVEANGTVLNSSGREVIKSNSSYSLYEKGGWTVAGYNGDIYDDQFRLVFKEGSYHNAEFVGDRFIVFSRDGEGNGRRTYDRVTGKYVGFEPTELGNDFYLTVDMHNKKKLVFKNGKMLDLPPFTNIERKNYNDFITIEMSEHNGIERESEDRHEWIKMTVGIQGVLDTGMKLIAPMAHVDLSQAPLGYFVGQRYDSVPIYTLYDKKGKKALQSNEKITTAYVGDVATATDGSSSLLISDTGVMLRTRCILSCLFATGVDEGRFKGTPVLLALTDSNNNTGIYDVRGRMLQPHDYHVVDKKSKAAVTLKKDDSLYFMDYRGRLLFGGRGFDGRRTFVTDGLAAIMRDGNGKWGIIGPHGETTVQFTYDTAYRDSKGNHFIGGKGVMQGVNNMGELQPVIKTGDSTLQKQETKKAMRKRRMQWGDQFTRVVTAYDGFEPGVYGDDGERLLPYVPRCMVTWATGSSNRPILAMIDTVNNEALAMDGKGQLTMPRIPRPDVLVVNQYATVALYRNKKDELHYLAGDKMKTETVTVDEQQKNELLKKTGNCCIVTGRSLTCKLADGRQCLVPRHAAALMGDGTDSMSEFGGMAYVRTAVGTGLRLFDGEWLCPPVCDSIVWRDGIFWLHKGEKKGARGPRGRPMIMPEYEGIYNLSSNSYVFPVKKEGKFSIMNNRAQLLTRGFDSISITKCMTLRNVPAWSGDTAYLLWLGRDGNIAEARDTLPPLKLTTGQPYVSEVMIVHENGKAGLYSNAQRKWLLPVQYEMVEAISDNNYVAWKNLHPGNKKTDTTILVNTEGHRLLTVAGRYRPRREHGDLWALEHYRPPYADANGRIIISDRYDNASPITDELLEAELKDEYGGKTGLITRKGRVALKPEFDEIEELGMDYLSAGKEVGEEEDLLLCLVSPMGKKLTPVKYDKISMMRNDGSDHEIPLFEVEAKGLHGITDSNGRTLIKCSYPAIMQVYRYKVASVQAATGKYGVVALGGKTITPFVYDELGFFVNGKAYFKKNGKEGWLDMQGKEHYGEQ